MVATQRCGGKHSHRAYASYNAATPPNGTAAMRIRFVLIALSMMHAAAAAEAEYAIDPVHTRVAVFVDHAGFSHAIGTFSGASGTLRFDPDNPANARVDVILPLQRMDFGDTDWNRKLADGLFFASKRHPQIHFVSTSVEVLDAKHLRVRGSLELKGVQREVVLETALNSARRHPMSLRHTVGFSAITTLDRRDFHMGAYPNVIGNDVPVRIELEATRTSVEADPATPQAPVTR